MNATLLEPVELRSRAFEVLVKSLGLVNTVRFIQQFDRSSHNYTAERDAILPDWNAADLIRQMGRQ